MQRISDRIIPSNRTTYFRNGIHHKIEKLDQQQDELVVKVGIQLHRGDVLKRRRKIPTPSCFYRYRISALTRNVLRPPVSYAVLFPNVVLLASTLGDLNHIIGSKIDDISVEFLNLQFC